MDRGIFQLCWQILKPLDVIILFKMILHVRLFQLLFIPAPGITYYFTTQPNFNFIKNNLNPLL